MFDTDTESLERVAVSDDVGPGRKRAAYILLKATTLDTVERRDRALQIAHTGMNLGLWGRFSDAVHYAALDLSRMIHSGQENAEHSTERIAREARELERDRIRELNRIEASVFNQ